MHRFEDLVERGAHFMLQASDAYEIEVLIRLETGAATGDVKTLQMLQQQRAVLAVGMFSMLEAHLQRPGDGKYAFNAVAARLGDAGEHALADEFTVLKYAINAPETRSRIILCNADRNPCGPPAISNKARRGIFLLRG